MENQEGLGFDIYTHGAGQGGGYWGRGVVVGEGQLHAAAAGGRDGGKEAWAPVRGSVIATPIAAKLLHVPCSLPPG